MAEQEPIAIGTGPVDLRQWDLSKSRSFYSESLLAKGRFEFAIYGWEGCYRGSLILSEAESATMKNAFVRHTAFIASLLAILPYAESRAEDMLDDVTEYAEGGTLRAEAKAAADKATTAVDAAKALLASLDG